MKIKENILNILNYKFSTKEKQINRPDFDKKVYVTLDQALNEIKKRRNDPALRKKVEDFLGDIPLPLENEINAVFFRFITTPQFETKRFFDITTGFGVKPLFWEYFDDKFHPANKCKYTLGKLSIYKGLGKTGKSIIKKKTVVDFNYNNGKCLKDVETIQGKCLVDFHHNLLSKMMPDAMQNLYDGSDWLHRHGGSAKKYYENFLALFLYHGILFENFSFDQVELDFTTNTFLEAFHKIQKKFGLTPLIVALYPTETEDEEFWNSYPHHVEGMIE
jgi:hypothetical protein